MSNLANLVLEVYSEEIPVIDDIERIFKEAFEKKCMGVESFQVFSGVCRIGVIANISMDFTTIFRGPAVGAHQPAIDGFCRKHKIAGSPEIMLFDNKAYYVCRSLITAQCIMKMLEEFLGAVAWPVMMSWGDGIAKWVRPIKSILCILDGIVMPVKFCGITASNLTFGHKFLENRVLQINSSDEYYEKLRANHVEPERKRRRDIILGAVSVCPDKDLIEELAGMVEYPWMLKAHLPEKFLRILPAEILVASLRSHQKYITVVDERGLLTQFVWIVSNIPDIEGIVLRGHERVIAARLEDVLFYYEQDTARPLVEYVPGLADIMFHREHGSFLQKAVRLMRLVVVCYYDQRLSQAIDIDILKSFDYSRDLFELFKLCGYTELLQHKPLINVLTAALVSNADMLTNIVREYPELHGIFGACLMSSEEVKMAVRSVSMNEQLTDVNYHVGLLDRFDTLVGLYAAGERSTATKDPLGLRRIAISIIHAIIDNELVLDLFEIIDLVLAQYEVRKCEVSEIFDFIKERFYTVLMNDYPGSVVHAVDLHDGDLCSIYARAEALRQLGKALAPTYIRLRNMVDTDQARELLADSFTGSLEQMRISDVERKLRSAFVEILDAFGLSGDLGAKDNIRRTLGFNIEEKIGAVKGYIKQLTHSYIHLMHSLIDLDEFVNRFFRQELVFDNSRIDSCRKIRLLKDIYDVMSVVGDLCMMRDGA